MFWVAPFVRRSVSKDPQRPSKSSQAEVFLQRTRPGESSDVSGCSKAQYRRDQSREVLKAWLKVSSDPRMV